MDECKFQVGDCVEAVVDHPDQNEHIHIGDTGVVCYIIDPYRVGIAWDKTLPNGHSCDEHCEYRHGWYVDTDTIRIPEEDGDIDIDDNSFLNVISGL